MHFAVKVCEVNKNIDSSHFHILINYGSTNYSTQKAD